MNNTLLLKNVRPYGKEQTDILIKNGYISEIGTNIKADDVTIEDGNGAIAVPGLVEAHAHLDKNLLGMGWRPNEANPSLIGMIENERRLRKEWDIDAERQSARQVDLAISHGTTFIRSHVDVDTEIGIAGIEGVLATKDKYKGVMDIEIVAFPQSGMMCRPGTVELMNLVLSEGADVVGGLDPCSIDNDPKGHLDTVFALAEKHGKPIDIHLHEPGELGAFSMSMIIERVRAHGMQGRIVISHAFCLGMPDRAQVHALVEQLAAERIAISTVGTPSMPVPAAAELRDAGVVLCAGSDGIRDTWSPYGNGDMLERAMIVGLRNNFRKDEDVEHALWICSHGGAKALGIADYGLQVECAADLVMLSGESITQAVVERRSRKLVIKGGQIVVRKGKTCIKNQ